MPDMKMLKAFHFSLFYVSIILGGNNRYSLQFFHYAHCVVSEVEIVHSFIADFAVYEI